MKELLENQTLTTVTVGASSGTGTRTFISGTGTPDYTMPVIGEAFYDAVTLTTYNGINAVSITEVPYEITGYPIASWKKKYVVNYASEDFSYSYTQTPPEESESWTGGAGALSIENPSGHWREYTPATVGPLPPETNLEKYDAMTGRVVMNYATGVFTKTQAVLAFNKASTIASFLAVAGKLNNATFDGFAKGQVLCESMDGSTRVRGDGLTEYLFTIRYHWKKLGSGIANDDWQYAWSSNNGWIRPALGDAITGGVSVDPGFIYEYGSIDIF